MSPYHMQLVDDPREQQKIVRRWTRGSRVPQALHDRAILLRPAERIALLYPAGVRRGVLFALRNLAAHDRLPRTLPHPTNELVAAEAYAAGVAKGVTPPPKAVFTQRVEGTIVTIFSAGAERGAMIVLEQAK
jgi:hypothetical protein